MNQPNLFEMELECCCPRCGVRCKVDPLAGSKAKMLKRGESPKGLCVNCAVHDFLRNTYPVNLILALSGPKSLAFPHIQELFARIMRSRCSDAVPDEIGWQAIIDNWDLPFPHKLKRSVINPVDQAELDRAPQEEIRRRKFIDERLKDPRSEEEISDDNYKKAEALLLNAMRKRDEDI
ncbi:MAG TPA: hypothetical protein VMY06_14755 [Sedimentisphaerales bacterium]|nr:hypothetical protein [Sedimentisphaerales bacterium]HUU15598.1 hypothetical protein [Sedimentisphaerales bacterium]